MSNDQDELVYDTDECLAQREGWRARARAVFFASSDARQVFDLVRHSVTDCVYGLSGRSWKGVPHASYYVGLFAAYVRTQGIVLDLARDSEVLDGTTLLRRQLELVARLRELDATDDASSLRGRTPNIGVLKSKIRGLYGGYSEVAHSSVERVFDLLGSGEPGAEQWVSMHPKFSVNSHVLLHNAAMVHLDFLLWMREFGERFGISIDRRSIDGPISELVPALNRWDPLAATAD
ncbi:hypothetical protein [Microbacterium rhizomatis]|uniref:Uncharacterized protein n=1 Tax=Microbacterium rhizomatis TaxID=1631477 RepID=A0A5J5J0R4_9MICO|nr:hypothetical protein [Microbacterium rhizomatis]KAA9108055.1 hypothetical protein F6B43_11610 [Microbacterium rhizomatis]